MAEHTMIGRYPCSTCFLISFETYVILSGVAREDPPNFMTILVIPFTGGAMIISSPTLSSTLGDTFTKAFN